MLTSLTVTRHSDCDTFLQSTVLTPISVDSEYWTLLILCARTILNFLLNRTSEEPLNCIHSVHFCWLCISITKVYVPCNLRRREPRNESHSERQDFYNIKIPSVRWNSPLCPRILGITQLSHQKLKQNQVNIETHQTDFLKTQINHEILIINYFDLLWLSATEFKEAFGFQRLPATLASTTSGITYEKT